MRPGKASYMSPEQVRGERADYRSDIFSLGIILYELTLCQRLYRGAPEVIMRKIVEEQVTPPTAINRDYPPTLELIVMKALEKRPDDRYQSAEEMSHDLEEFLEESGLRSGNRRMAHYMHEVFGTGAAASESGGTASRSVAEPRPAAGGPARATIIWKSWISIAARRSRCASKSPRSRPRPPPVAARPGPARQGCGRPHQRRDRAPRR